MSTEPTNNDRAERVRELFHQYRDKYDAGEPLDTALADMITDLLHLSDTFPAADCEHGCRGDAWDLLDKAQANYDEERYAQ